jgi:hypothetical protein
MQWDFLYQQIMIIIWRVQKIYSEGLPFAKGFILLHIGLVMVKGEFYIMAADKRVTNLYKVIYKLKGIFKRIETFGTVLNAPFSCNCPLVFNKFTKFHK